MTHDHDPSEFVALAWSQAEQAIKELESDRDQLAERIHRAVDVLNAIVMPSGEALTAKRILTGEDL